MDNFLSIWKRYFPQSRGIEGDFSPLVGLATEQFEWLLQEYKSQTIFGSPQTFIDFSKELWKQDTVPEPLAASAYLSKDSELIKLAEKLEILRGAWFANFDGEMEAEKIREKLRRILA